MNESLEEFRYDDSCSVLYSFIYDSFCSWFIELSKPVFESENTEDIKRRATVLKFAFRQIVALLHPIAPFITEELWSYLKNDDEDLLIIQDYPEFNKAITFETEQNQMNKLIEVISLIRNLRASVNIKPKEEISAVLRTDDKVIAKYFSDNQVNFLKLAKINSLSVTDKNHEAPEKSLIGATTHTEVYLPLEGVIDISEQVTRLNKELKKTTADFQKYDKKINNEKFMNNAKEEVITEVKENHAELLEKITSLNKYLKSFS